jgi:hypothetical protein
VPTPRGGKLVGNQAILDRPIDNRDITRYVNRAALIDQIQQARETLEKLLTLLQSTPVERDRFVSHLYQSRREYLRTCGTGEKSGKQIERCVAPKPNAWHGG